MVKTGAMKKEQYDWFAGATKSIYGTTSDQKMAFACKNAGFFGLSLMLAAKNAGLDSHPMDGLDVEDVKKAFNIPDQYWVPLLLAIGHLDKSKTLLPAKMEKKLQRDSSEFLKLAGIFELLQKNLELYMTLNCNDA